MRFSLRSLCNTFRDFNACKRGNVLLTFALALIPLVGSVGFAVDYSRGNSTKAAMQAALDATALMLSKEVDNVTTEQMDKKANDYFLALFNHPDANNIVVTSKLTPATSTEHSKLRLDATAKVPTTFMKIFGYQNMDLGMATEAVWGVKRLELAMALDVTGSMASNNKINELKKAAKSLLTILKKTAKKDGDIKIAVVPFAVNVNVGNSNANANWLDWSDWRKEPAIMPKWLGSKKNQSTWDRTGPGGSCPLTTTDHGFRCTNGPSSKGGATVTTIPTSGTYANMICPSKDDGSESTAETGVLTGRNYTGCYTSVLRPNTAWYPVKTGSTASCGSLSSNDCQCTGSGSSKVCVMHPDSNWQPIAMGSSAVCGSLSSSVCQCFGSGSNKVCRQRSYDHTWRPLAKTEWNGCVRDRNQDYDAQNTAPASPWTSVQVTNMNGAQETYRDASTPATSDYFQPFQMDVCPAEMMPLTFDWSALEQKVDALSPTGNTNVSIGLAWAFHALTASGPLNTAAPVADDLDKAIILLTDGDNTQNRWSNTQSLIDERTKKTCDAIKAWKKPNGDPVIKVYTIRVIDGNASLLQQCATKTDMYYNVQNASELNAVFTQIAQALANLRIAK